VVPVENLEKIAKDQRDRDSANRVPGNALKALTDAVPGELDSLRARRADLVDELRAVNSRIADLETHALVAGVDVKLTAAEAAAENGAHGARGGSE
jgi:hypothetical protein